MGRLVWNEMNRIHAPVSYKTASFAMAILIERVFVSFSDISKLKLFKS